MLRQFTNPPGTQGHSLPSPYKPVISAVNHCASQRARRTRILASARAAVAVDGYSGVNIRDVADRSQVSVQTVYNLVGNRSTLLSESICEYIESLGGFAFAKQEYVNEILALTCVYCASVELFSDYIRSATMTYFPPDRPLFTRVEALGMQLLGDALSSMQKRGQIESDNWTHLVPRITAFQTMMMLDAVCGAIDKTQLKRDLVLGTASMLRPSVTAAHMAEIDSWIEQAGLA